MLFLKIMNKEWIFFCFILTNLVFSVRNFLTQVIELGSGNKMVDKIGIVFALKGI